MGIFILICISIGFVCFFNSWTFQSWMRRQRQEQREAEEKQRQEQREDIFYDKAGQFYTSIVTLDSVKAMASRISEIVKGMMVQGIQTARENVTESNIHLLVTTSCIQRQEFSLKFNDYIWVSDDKTGLSFPLSDFGIQMSKESFKAYGLSLALESLIVSQESSFPAEVKDFKVHANVHRRYDDDFDVILVLSWTVEQNKFIEL